MGVFYHLHHVLFLIWGYFIIFTELLSSINSQFLSLNLKWFLLLFSDIEIINLHCVYSSCSNVVVMVIIIAIMARSVSNVTPFRYNVMANKCK